MPHLKINRKLERFLTTPKPIKVAIGGRGSGKSIGFGDIFTMKMATERADVFCLREYQDSINDSVHRVFADSINKRLDLKGWSIQENKVTAPNGAKTTYKGAARNPDSIQSAQGYKYSWYEEAHRASKASLDKLLPTILRNPGAECWFSANPQSSVDPFSERLINPYLKELEQNGFYEDEIHLIIVVNWRDNPWWNKEQELLRQWDFDNRPRAEYDWIWEGKFNDAVEDSLIKPEWVDAAIDAHVKIPFQRLGVKCLSFDPADSGDDDKAIASRHGSVITHAQAWSEGELPDAIDKAFDAAYSLNSDVIVYDGEGLGAGVKVGLDQRVAGKRIDVQSYKGSNSVDNPTEQYIKDDESREAVTNENMFRNKRAQYWWYLRDRFEATYNAVERNIYTNPENLISLSSEIECINQIKSELCRVKRKRTNNSLIQIESKADMKKRLVPSPNLADALVMCFANDLPSFKQARSSSKRNRNWRAA
jgi:phage terminase large subunit